MLGTADTTVLCQRALALDVLNMQLTADSVYACLGGGADCLSVVSASSGSGGHTGAAVC